MLKLGFITNVQRWSTFNDKIIGKTSFNLSVRVKYRITEMFFFFFFFFFFLCVCVFLYILTEKGDSIMGVKQENVFDSI